MIRRVPLRLSMLIATAAIGLSACATFTDADVAASVNASKLSFSELDRRAALLPPDPTVSVGVVNRAVAAEWIALQLSAEIGLVEEYEKGPADSGIACFAALPAPDLLTAEADVGRLDNGLAWADYASEVAPDDAVAGRQPCTAMAALGELAALFDNLTATTPHDAVEIPGGGAFIIRMQPVTELAGIELLQTATTTHPAMVDEIVASASDHEVIVSARIGEFDPERLAVTPLG